MVHVYYLPVYKTLPNHPKLLEAAGRLGVDPDLLLAKLLRLWLWALDYALDGNLKRFNSGVLAKAANWQGDGEAFLVVLVETGWFDPDGSLHDWDEYVGKLLDKKVAATLRATRSREERKLLASSTDVARNVRATEPHAAPSKERRGDQRTEQEHERHADDPADDPGELKLRMYWAKIKGKAPTVSDRTEIIRALSLPGMTADRILGVIDPVVEWKRKKGEAIGGFGYFTSADGVLYQEVKLATMRRDLSASGLAGSPQVLQAASKPKLQDRDHYEVLVATGTFNPNEWANASEYDPEDEF